MKEVPLAVVISVLVKEGKILLIKRMRGDYVGLLGLPGGKIEKNEHLSEAAVREIVEESGIQSVFKRHLGFVSEHLMENGAVLQHFLLHVCELDPLSTDIKNDAEGTLAWFDMDELTQRREEVIPSDFLIIEKVVKQKEKEYYDCVIEKVGEQHFLKRFE